MSRKPGSLVDGRLPCNYAMDPPLSRPQRRSTRTIMHYKRSSLNRFGRKPGQTLGTPATTSPFRKARARAKAKGKANANLGPIGLTTQAKDSTNQPIRHSGNHHTNHHQPFQPLPRLTPLQLPHMQAPNPAPPYHSKAFNAKGGKKGKRWQ